MAARSEDARATRRIETIMRVSGEGRLKPQIGPKTAQLGSDSNSKMGSDSIFKLESDPNSGRGQVEGLGWAAGFADFRGRGEGRFVTSGRRLLECVRELEQRRFAPCPADE